MFWNILRMEGDKVLRRRLLWIGLMIAVLPMVIAFISIFNVDKGSPLSRYWDWPGGLISALSFANGYSPGVGYATYLLAAVVGVVTAQEYSWRTLQLWLSHGISRPLLLLAKFVLALATVLLTTLAFLLVGALVSIILTSQLHGGTPNASLDSASLLLSYLRTCYGLLPYVALTFLFVVVSRSAAVAISGLILFMLAIELPLTLLLPLLGKSFAQVAQFFPAGLAQTMNQQN
jgi:ABC-2 type transport system permease protein